jgi:hypothetical protein
VRGNLEFCSCWITTSYFLLSSGREDGYWEEFFFAAQTCDKYTTEISSIKAIEFCRV